MKMSNEDIRLYAKGCGVPFWRIAEEMGTSELTFTRLMRKELSKEQKSEIKKIINKVKGE